MVKVNSLNKYFNKKHSNQTHVINNTTIEFPRFGLVTILGESGSGKTTLLNVIGGLDNFDSGSIQIDEYDIQKYNARKTDRMRNEKIGYIFQNFLLLNDRSVYYNLELMLNMYKLTNDEKKKRIEYTLKAVGMLKYKNKSDSYSCKCPCRNDTAIFLSFTSTSTRFSKLFVMLCFLKKYRYMYLLE